MREKMRNAALALLAGSLLLLGPQAGEAGHEPLALYENWTTAPTIRSDRWNGSGDFGQETDREVQGDKLVMRFRREGATGSDSGSTGFFSNRLFFANPGVVDAVEAEFRIRDILVTGCPANATASIARAATIDLVKFSDLALATIRPAGDLTGDYIARVQAARTSTSTDADGVVAITAILFRCNNAPCSNSTIIVGPITLGQAALNKKFRMRLTWDAPGNQFHASLNDDLEIPLSYTPASNNRPPNVPFVVLRTQHLPANCTVASGGPTVGDAEIEVRDVRTNVSAVIP